MLPDPREDPSPTPSTRRCGTHSGGGNGTRDAFLDDEEWDYGEAPVVKEEPMLGGNNIQSEESRDDTLDTLSARASEHEQEDHEDGG
jgi:hypothetical protein